MSKAGRDYLLFIEDILEAIRKIESYAGDLTFDEFSKNSMALDAIIRNFEVIGEASKNVPKRIRDKYPDVEWKEATGFRNVLIHNYFGIDVEAVWDTLHNNIPLLKKHVEEVFKTESASGDGLGMSPELPHGVTGITPNCCPGIVRDELHRKG
jgi:uncharacterized protein with HEPN domain